MIFESGSSTRRPPQVATALRRATDDAQLNRIVRRIAGRDSGALAELYGVLAFDVLQTVHTQLPDPAASEAVLRATFVEVWRLAQYHTDTVDSVRDWVCAVATRRAMERARYGRVPASSWQAEFGRDHERQQQIELSAIFAAA